jgi:selenocysteine-specific elongation factor
VTDGGRVAINIVGEDEPGRGGVLTTDPGVGATVDVLAVLREPARLDRRAGTGRWPPRAGSTFRLHLGTDNVDATLGRGARAIASLPDARLVARLRLARPVAAAIGDHFVLRHASPASTAAGGAILDVQAPIGPSRRRITPGLLEALATGSRASRLAIHGILPAEDAPGWEVASDVAEAMENETLAGIETGRGRASGPGIHLAELRRDLLRSLRRRVSVERIAAAVVVESLIEALVESGRVVRDGDVVRPVGVEPTGPDPALIAAMDRLERLVDAASPPALSESARVAGCSPEGVRRLEAEGRIVRLDADLAYTQPTFQRLQSQALALAMLGPLTPAALRDATGTSRKYVMALLDELDRRGVLARTPTGHVIGPRAPRPGSLGSPEPVAASRRLGE